MAKRPKTITEVTVDDLIKVIETVGVHINYRDNRFLIYTKSYASYVAKKSKGKAGQKKTPFTFADVIAELTPQDKERLEKSYIDSKTKKALKANANLLDCIPDAKEQISRAFIPFIDEVQGELEEIIKEEWIDLVHGKDGYLYRPKNTKGYKYGMKLVYRENVGTIDRFDNKKLIGDVPSDDKYTFETLPNLLDTIAKVTVDYCIKMDELKPIKKDSKNPRGQVTPMFIRQSCAFTCYLLLYFGDSLSKHFFNKPLNQNSGVCTQIMNDLHKRTIALGYEYFNKENKFFEYNKWSILPEVMLRQESYIAPSSPINYSGHKSEYLGYMLSSLVGQCDFKVYLEPFGGSGIGITQFPKKDGVSYYISDGNYMNMSYYRILKGSEEDFNEFIKQISDFQSEIDKLYNRIDKLYIRGSDSDYLNYFKNLSDKGLDKYYTKGKGFDSRKMTQTDVLQFFNGDFQSNDSRLPRLKNEAKVSMDVFYKLKDLYRPYKELYDYCDNNFLNNNILQKWGKTDLELAVAFTILHTSLLQGEVSIDQSILKQPTLRNLDVIKNFSFLREVYKDVDVVPTAFYGASAMDLLRDPTYNTKDTLAYLDSPYVETKGYGSPFDIVEIIDLIDACKKFRGKFIFSCRVNLPKKALKEQESKNIFVRFMSEWLNTDYKVLLLRERLVEGEVAENRKNKSDKRFKISQATISKLTRENKLTSDYLFLASCIELGQDLELMITNFDFDIPNYQDFLELFKKGKEAYEKEQNKVLVKMDMKDIADLVIFAYR